MYITGGEAPCPRFFYIQQSMKRYFTILSAVAAMAAAMLLSSCQEKVQPEPEDDYEATIKLSGSSTVSIGATEGSTGKLVFSCDHEWRIEVPEDADWFEANKLSGNSTKSTVVIFTAKANSGEQRTATCKIKSGSKTKKFTVSQDRACIILQESDIQDFDKYYKPAEFSNMNMLRSDAKWSWCRSKQSEHFVLFWEKGYDEYGLYGERMGVANTSPKTINTSSSYYVDIDDLLAKAEEFYKVNVDQLKFADTESGKSNLNKYKIQIYLLHQTEWCATGGGYDDVIGALWINPGTCKPVGSTIAHEIGHSFQYQVYCDAIANGAKNDKSTGWRYEIGNGCGFWEACANWQAFNSYAEQAFSSYNFEVFQNMHHAHFTHEHHRYASYFLMWYWAEKYGVSEIGDLWRNSKKPEDPIEAYQRIHNLTLDELWDELYIYAAKCATWDFDVNTTNLDEGKLTGTTQSVRKFGEKYIGALPWVSVKDAEGYYWPSTKTFESRSVSWAPEATGFNIIELQVPTTNRNISAEFVGQAGASGYHTNPSPQNAGWHVGYVALMNDGTREYTTAQRITDKGTVAYTVPEGCKRLWLVVLASPTKYMQHLWDEDDDNDILWPYKVKFDKTNLK